MIPFLILIALKLVGLGVVMRNGSEAEFWSKVGNSAVTICLLAWMYLSLTHRGAHQ